MNEAWIGRCVLRAHNEERRRWIGGHEEAAGDLLLLADSEADYASKIRSALHGLGYDLVVIESATLVSQAATGMEPRLLGKRLAAASRTRPIPVSSFVDSGRSVWREVDWPAILAEDTPLWAVIDGVSWPEISKALGQSGAEHCCLYSTLDPASLSYAPWLVRISPKSRFARDLAQRPQEDHSYVLLRSRLGMDAIRRHLRHFTMLGTPADAHTLVYFRFYDPRVLVDAADCLTNESRAKFLSVFDEIIAPLSPHILLPEGCQLKGEAITPFDLAKRLQGRLISLKPRAKAPGGTLQLSLTEQEFVQFGERMQRRAANKLARQLYRSHQDVAGPERCLEVASSAKQKAGAYQLTSVEQVSTFAKAELLLGPNFVRRYPQATRILTDHSIQPWQKKDRLAAWLRGVLGTEAMRGRG